MYQYKKLMVALNFTENDKSVLEFTRFFVSLDKCEEISFIYIEPEPDIPVYMPESYIEKLEKVKEAGFGMEKRKLRDRVKSILEIPDSITTNYIVEEGNVVDIIVKKAHDNDTDLLIIGRRQEHLAHKKISQKLAAISPCSSLVVPQDTNLEFSKIFIPVDYSDYSIYAVEEAAKIALQNKIKNIHLFHTYPNPHIYAGYTTISDIDPTVTEMPVDMIEKGRKEEVQKSLNYFIEKCDISEVSLSKEITENDDTIEAITQAAENYHADFMVMGSRGRTKTSFVLIGSTAEKMIWKTSLPLLIVKKKHENYGVIKALFGIDI